MIPGTTYRSPVIYLTVGENPCEPQLGDRLIKAVQPVIASDRVPCLEEEGRNEGKDSSLIVFRNDFEQGSPNLARIWVIT
jgi:hypothetical protein